MWIGLFECHAANGTFDAIDGNFIPWTNDNVVLLSSYGRQLCLTTMA